MQNSKSNGLLVTPESLRIARNLYRVIRKVPSYARINKKGWLFTFRLAVDLILKARFTSTEISNDGILVSEDPETSAAGRISKRALVELQEILNPVELRPLTGDKAILQQFMEAVGLTVIPTTAILYHGYRGRIKNQATLSTPEEWEAHFKAVLPEEFVVKPALGSRGVGVRFYSRDGDSVRSLQTGEILSIRELLRRNATDEYFRCYLFQERLYNHRSINELTGAPALQTSRVVTLLHSDNKVDILLARFRMGGPDAYIDHFRVDLKGAMVGQIDTQTGTIFHVVTRNTDGQLIEVETHPETGRPVKGFQFPDWDKVVELVGEGARALSPVRTIGWDVASTDEGPVIVEANRLWDPANEYPRPDVFARLKKEANTGN